MAGFEISATAARLPKAGTTASVREVREGSVGVLAGDAAVDGIDAAVFRDGETLPQDAAAAREAMAPWLQSGFWNSGDGNKFASFMLGVALHLERPVAVVQRQGKSFLNPVRIYGARDANGALVHSTAKPNALETVPTFKFVPFADLIETLRANPISCSVIEWNGSNHFDPWLLKPSLRAAAEAAAEPVEAADGEQEADGEEQAAAVESAVDGEAAAAGAVGEFEAALVDDEWVRMPGGPWTARLMRKARQPPDTADYRMFGVAVSFDAEHFPIFPGGAVKFVGVPGAPADGVVCQFPAVPNVGSQLLMFPLRLSKEGATDDTISITTVLYRKQVEGGEEDDGDEAMEADAEGEGSDEGGEMVASGGDDGSPRLPQWVIGQTSRRSDTAASAAAMALSADEPPLGDDDGDEPYEMIPGGDDAPPPPQQPQPQPPAALQPTPRQQRERKRKERYGDNGELEGPASSFRSAPAARKASIEASLEMGVPAFALPGEEVWAMGLHAGTRKRFKAEVIGLRKQFPRIIVKYTASEDGNTNAIALPEMPTAYLCAADVEPKDW